MADAPAYLTSGDSVILIATARKVSKAEIEPTLLLLASWGFNVICAPNLFETHHQFAGTDAQRIADLQFALNHPTAKAIICVRGGYGTSRIIDQVDFSHFLKHPKWICGFSDVTVLLMHTFRLGVQSVHSLMPLLFNKPEYADSVQSLEQCLIGLLHTCKGPNHPLNIKGTASGPLIGGNLSILHSLIDTKSEPSYQGAILLLEDIDEYLYHIDRVMVHLVRSNRLQRLKGIVVGHFSDMKDNPIPFGQSAYEIINAHVKGLQIPVAYGFPSGHEPHNVALRMGALVTFNVTEQGSSINFT